MSEPLARHILQAITWLIRGRTGDAEKSLDRAWVEYENHFRYGDGRTDSEPGDGDG